jgi:hypothetical protein
MELQSLLPSLQVSATGRYRKLDQANPHPPTLFP